MSFHVNRVVIAGVGLIGGSLAAALKQEEVVDEVIGLGRSRKTLMQAMSLKLIDSIADSPAQAAQADLIVLAVPVTQTEAVLAALAPHLDEKTVVTDVGSTKSDVIAAARRALKEKFCRFVPGHPVAGAEQNGPQAARADLFRGKNVILCPEADTDEEALAKVGLLWTSTGASVTTMPALRHDQIFAAISHLPHLAAFALVDDLACRSEADEFFRFAASGFRDFTRIAGSSPEIWRDIALSNRQAILVELSAYLKKLAKIAAALEQQDATLLEQIFTRASEARRQWGRK